jgi:hypothetical protein
MDKEEWSKSLEELKKLLSQRKRDIEELEVTIAAYEEKIKSFEK